MKEGKGQNQRAIQLGKQIQIGKGIIQKKSKKHLETNTRKCWNERYKVLHEWAMRTT